MGITRQLSGTSAVLTLLVILTVGASDSSAAQTSAAQTSAASEAVVLSGTNIITGTGTGRVTVRLEEAARLDLSPTRASGSQASAPAALHTSGGSGYVGFLLLEQESTDGFMALALRTPEHLPSDSGPAAATGYGRPSNENRSDPLSIVPGSPARCTICYVPAGVYDLYLITGAEPATVTMTLDGLSGITHMEPTQKPFSFQRTSAAAVEGPADSSTIQSGGRRMSTTFPVSAEIDQPGLLIDSFMLSVTARNQPQVALATVSDCRDAGGGSICDEHVLAGPGQAAGGLVLTAGRFADNGVSTSLTWDVTGDARYRARHDYMWVSMGGQDTALPQERLISRDATKLR